MQSPKHKQLLQVQTDFNATLPINIHKPAGSITIKADYRKKGGVQQKPGSIQVVNEEASDQGPGPELTNSTGKLNVSSFKARGDRNQKNNGLRPVRLFNYATAVTESAPRESLN